MVDTVAHAFVRSANTRTIGVPGHANARVEGVVAFTAAVKDGGGISTQQRETFIA